MGDFEPIHTGVWDKLDNLSYQVYQLKRANTALQKKLRYERRENVRLRKEMNPDGKKHYRNSRKKGAYGRMG